MTVPIIGKLLFNIYGSNIPAREWPLSPALEGINSCISSIKRITSPAFSNSFIDFSIRSSIFFSLEECAINPLISNCNTLLSFNCCGTSPLLIFCAIPNIILDFPTPGSPISNAFLLEILPSTDTKFSISSSCPIPYMSLSFKICSLIFFVKLFNMNVYPYTHEPAIPPFLK